jgi:hypothetical protein
MLPSSQLPFFSRPLGLPFASLFPLVPSTDGALDFFSSWILYSLRSSPFYVLYKTTPQSSLNNFIRIIVSQAHVDRYQPSGRFLGRAFNSTTSVLAQHCSARRTLLFGFNLERS